MGVSRKVEELDDAADDDALRHDDSVAGERQRGSGTLLAEALATNVASTVADRASSKASSGTSQVNEILATAGQPSHASEPTAHVSSKVSSADSEDLDRAAAPP